MIPRNIGDHGIDSHHARVLGIHLGVVLSVAVRVGEADARCA
jgi:hypothetical protein